MLHLIKFKDTYGRNAYKVFSEKGNNLASIYESNDERWRYTVSLNANYSNQRFSTIIEAKRYILKTFEFHDEPVSEKASQNVKYLPTDEESLKNFYPTPNSLIGKMLGKVKWEGVNSVLEPSAGRGDIVDCLKKATECRRRYSVGVQDIDCIEIDPNLRSILKGKEYRVVGDDFLSFNTQKRYDAIIMNPPFDHGDAHLLKAIQMQKEGGQIVCLLNAETLRNPYTVQRKVLLQTMLKYNASVEFVKNAFSKAARKTDVEIAIVSLNIPKQEFASEIFEKMKKAEEKKYELEECREVTSSEFCTNIIAEYNVEVSAGIELIKQYYAMIPHMKEYKPKKEDAAYTYNKALYDNPIITLKVNDHRPSDMNEAINSFVKMVRRKYWSYILTSKEFASNMTSDMKDAYTDKIREMENYEISRFNLETVWFDICQNVQRGVVESIMKLFDKLSAEHAYFPECSNNVHYYSGWCSNKAHKVNMKCIIPTYGIIANHSWSKCFEMREAYNLLSDLEKSLNYLSGNDVSSFVDLETILNSACERGQRAKISCRYFEVTFYKKGTTHIKFYDQALIDKLNIFAAQNKNWLPPRYGKVRYDDLNEEEKTVVDEFQAKGEYQKVFNNPSQYVVDVSPTMPLLMGA